jgi:predicted dithiol-disulfide oxidoreductase (DUF899 family)
MTERKVGTREEWLAARKEPYFSQLLDRTPKGRVDEFRATRHDEYENQ